MNAKFSAWLKQPTTVAAISTAVGTVFAAMSGQMSWAAAAPILVATLVGAIMPDNSAAKTGAQTSDCRRGADCGSHNRCQRRLQGDHCRPEGSRGRIVTTEIGIRLIAEAVMLKVTINGKSTVLELTRDEAQSIRDSLDSCIYLIEVGGSVAPDYASFLSTLPDPRKHA